METTTSKPRRAWLAALLSLLFGPVGQAYAGDLRRSIFLWLVNLSLALLFALAWVTLPPGKLVLVLVLLSAVAFPIYLAVDAYWLARRNRDAPLKPYQRWWVYVLLYLAYVAGGTAVSRGITSYIAEAFVSPTRSMSPTIHDGDRILVDKLWSRGSRLRRGDVVAYRRAGAGSPLFVMRVAGLPGEEIEIKDERVFIDGKEWEHASAVFSGPLPDFVELANYGPLTIPTGSFFVLGDNRRIAADSRLSGPIPLADFHGRARLIYWSQLREYPDPDNRSHYTLGPIRWNRIGASLD